MRTRYLAAALLATSITAVPAQVAQAASHPRVTSAQLAQVGRLLLVATPGPSLDPVTKLLMTRYKLGGVVLFGRNITSAAQLKALDAAFHKVGGSGGFLVTVDQEGGTVRRISSAQPVVSAAAAGQAGPAAVKSLMTTSGRQLKALGVDVDLAPVADRSGGFLGTRSYGSSPAPDVAAAVEGLQAGGVLATAKHFPGLTGLRVSTDDAPGVGQPVSSANLAPFVAAVKAHVGLLMVDLAVHPGLGSQPAALESSTYALLRGPKVGYQGPVITDALDAAAVRKIGEVQAAVRAIQAGADLVTVPGGPILDTEVIAGISHAVMTGKISPARYLEALKAATTLEAKHG